MAPVVGLPQKRNCVLLNDGYFPSWKTTRPIRALQKWGRHQNNNTKLTTKIATSMGDTNVAVQLIVN